MPIMNERTVLTLISVFCVLVLGALAAHSLTSENQVIGDCEVHRDGFCKLRDGGTLLARPYILDHPGQHFSPSGKTYY